MARTFEAGGRVYRISNHSRQKIRELDIEMVDIARIIENRANEQRLKHKTEYTGCYRPRWARRRGLLRRFAVKIVINTRSTLTLKTVYITGDCPEDEANENNV